MNRIGIVTGMPFERDLMLRAGGRHGWGEAAPLVEACGVGGADAERVVRQMAEAGVVGIVSFGIAGGLDPDLKTGDLILPKMIVDTAGNGYEATFEWRGQLAKYLTSSFHFVGGALLATPTLVTSCRQKSDLRQQHGAVAVDMESFAIARAADAAGLLFVALRAVSDPADQGLPTAVAAGTRGGKLAFGRLATDVLKHPGQIGDLVRLGLNTRKAKSVLVRACETVGPAFVFSRPL